MQICLSVYRRSLFEFHCRRLWTYLILGGRSSILTEIVEIMTFGINLMYKLAVGLFGFATLTRSGVLLGCGYPEKSLIFG